jgi:RHS repeat-associated protein
MLPVAEEEMLSPLAQSRAWGEERVFSFAAGVGLAALETHQGANTTRAKKPHQGIFSENRRLRFSAMWAKWSGTHQDRSGSWWKSVLGSALDANGNTLSDASGKSYSWDFENRLTQAVVPGTNGGTTTFKYDPFGRRIQKSGPLGTTNYLYDGANIIQETDNGGNVLARYAQGGWLDEPLSQSRAGTTSFYELDGNLSITSLTASSGAVANTYTYDSFGRQTATSGTIVDLFRYSGRDYDSETGLSYNRSRYFDPSAGRFLSADPIGFGGGINFYSYVHNDPVDWIDPWGNGKSKAECWRMFKQIQAMGTALANEIAKYNPVADGMGGWPMAGGRLTKPGGHYMEMGGYAAGIATRAAQYYKDCGDSGTPSIGQCVWGAVKKFKTLQLPVIPMSAAEYEMQADSQRYMAEFWRDLLIGDFALGIVGTGGAAGGFGGAGAAAGEGAGGLLPAFAQ